MTDYEPSPIKKLVVHIRLHWNWFVLLVSTILILLPFAVAALEGILVQFLYDGVWRPMLMGPAIIIYILILLHPMQESRARAIESLRQVVLLDDREFDRLVQQASDVDDRVEVLAFLGGAAFGILTGVFSVFEGEELLLKLYLPIVNALMFGLLSWLIVNSLVGTKLESTLLRQPLDVDIFDLKPFEPIARSSLITGLAFIGGGAISALFINLQEGGLNAVTLVLYGMLILVAVLAFFLGMRHTHRVLARAKNEALETVQDRISAAFRRFSVDGDSPNIEATSIELDVWFKYEERVKKARTWPYNTTMLRTLFLSTFIPAVTWLAQYVLGRLFGN